MEALIALATLALLAVLATRFGHDSRPGLRTKEQNWAAQGMTWRDEPRPPASGAHRFAEEMDVFGDQGTSMRDYPVLALIDRALGAAGPGYATAADAARLERRAREVTDEYWGETVWLTGRVSEAALRVVCAMLERERSATDESTKTAGPEAPAVRPPVTAGGLVPPHPAGDREGVGQQWASLPTAAILPPSAAPA